MARLANIKPKEAIKAFEKAGFIQRKQTGSHVIMKNYANGRIVSVPVHSRDIKIGLLSALIRKSGLNVQKFLNLL